VEKNIYRKATDNNFVPWNAEIRHARMSITKEGIGKIEKKTLRKTENIEQKINRNTAIIVKELIGNEYIICLMKNTNTY